MRILMVSQALPFLPCHDGFRVIPAHLLRELSGRHEFFLVALSDGMERQEELEWPSQYCAEVQIVRTKAPHGLCGSIMRRVRETPPDLAAAVSRCLTTVRPDVLHLEGPSMASVALLAPTGVARVLSAHDSISLRYAEFLPFARSRRDALSCRIRSFQGRWHEGRWYKNLDRVVVTSAADSTSLQRSIPCERISVIPNGIDLDHWSYRPSPVPGRVVFSGNMSWPPNEDAAEYFARQVFPVVRGELPGAEYWIVGASPSARVRDLGSIAGVKVTGTVPDIREYVRSASVYASSLRFGAGVKNKILEAMALGAPIVATSASLTGTPVTHGRHLMIANSASDIAIETVHLLRNAGARDRLSAEARRLIETEYSWRRIAGMFVREWEAGLHQPNHGNKLAQESSVNHTKPAIKDLD